MPKGIGYGGGKKGKGMSPKRSSGGTAKKSSSSSKSRGLKLGGSSPKRRGK